MKRIAASIGMAALAAACVQSSNAQADGSKPWTASVALRGFYDDNVNTAPGDKVDTFGAEISPTLAFALAREQTTASLAYTYTYKYYETPPSTSTGHDDMTHNIAAGLTHLFDERNSISLFDSFVIGQEPDLLRSGPDYASFQRISGDNVRNFGGLTYNHEFTRKIGVEIGYVNSVFNYEDDIPSVVSPSYSALLDRIEQTAHIDARWTIQPTTVGLIGYAFSSAHYTADQPIGVYIDPANIFNSYIIDSSARDSRSHYAYVGAEHTFLPGFHGSLRVGARFTDYPDSPENQSSTSPYLSAKLSYDYAEHSSVQFGFSHDLSATDQFTVQNGSITSDTAATVVYASVTHRFLPKLSGTLLGQFQNSTFQGGAYDGQSEQYYVLNASLTYQINRHLATSLSYNYDLLDSKLTNRGFENDRGFNRNRVYLSATFTY